MVKWTWYEGIWLLGALMLSVIMKFGIKRHLSGKAMLRTREVMQCYPAGVTCKSFLVGPTFFY